MESAFLVLCRDEGYGTVVELNPGQRYVLGRANICAVVLKDDLCSREHAELSHSKGHWYVRDLTSLNGTRLNGQKLEKEMELSPRDELTLGRTTFLFVEEMGELPDINLDPPEEGSDSVSIRKRIGETRILTPPPEAPRESDGGHEDSISPGTVESWSLSRDLSLLYRLALDMGSASEEDELVRIVLDALLEATSAEVGAVLSLVDGKKSSVRGNLLEPASLTRIRRGQRLYLVDYRHRDHSQTGYVNPSEYVSNEVLASKEAILAENVERDRHLRNRESINNLNANSLICAPIIFGERLFGLIHLYCTDVRQTLSNEDLDLAMAVAKQLGTVLHQFHRREELKKENRTLRERLNLESELVGESSGIEEIEKQISRVAQTNATCLIRGESGSGKELVARAIHYSSHRKEGPFVCLNCAALTETLLESELFGHERGAFTGATDQKIGKFEAADGGTIFLDEIGEMNVLTQAKLLRILEGHPYERVGGSTPIHSDVRVVAATNKPLEEAVRDGEFRRDLFFRLQVVEITIPPLRDRKADVPILAKHFLKKFVQETARRIEGFTDAALKKMEDYHWPGNVRELRNVVERAVALGTGPMLDADDIWLSSLELSQATVGDPNAPYSPMSLEEVERIHVARTLGHTDWNKTQAASILGIERSTLDRKIKLYELKKA